MPVLAKSSTISARRLFTPFVICIRIIHMQKIFENCFKELKFFLSRWLEDEWSSTCYFKTTHVYSVFKHIFSKWVTT